MMQLEQVLGLREVLEPKASDRLQRYLGGHPLFGLGLYGLRGQYLAPVRGGRDARGLMHGKADVVIVLIDDHLADVDPHPNEHARVGGPRGFGQRHLSIDRTEYRRGGIGEGHEQGVSFALQDGAAVSGECVAKHTPVLGKELPVVGP
jgi:hypothetical protein